MATKQDLETASDVTGVTTDRCVTRRGLMRAGVATAGAATFGGAGLRYGSRDAAAQTTLEWGIGALGGAAGLAYVAYNGGISFLGDERDYSGYTGADALKTEIEKGGIEMVSADERVMTSIENNISTSQAVALAKGKAAIIEKMNNGGTETEAVTAMQDAIDGYYTTIETNVFNHWSEQNKQFYHMYEQAETHSNVNAPGIFQWVQDTGTWYSIDNASMKTTDVSLIDGSSLTIDYMYASRSSNNMTVKVPTTSVGDEEAYGIDGPSTKTEVIEAYKYESALSSVSTERDDVNAQLSGFVTDVYNEYEAGDIPTEDLVDPITASTELRQNYDGYQGQGAHAAMAGIPTTAEQSVEITVHRESGDTDLLVDIYTSHVPTDADGNEIGFESGMKYDPSGWSAPLFIAYQFTDADGNEDIDFVQLEDQFTINSITNKNGETVSDFKTKSQNIQTSDITKLQEELDQIREEQLRLQEESQDDPSGGGGSLDFSNFSIGSIPGTGVVLAIVGGAAFLLGND